MNTNSEPKFGAYDECSLFKHSRNVLNFSAYSVSIWRTLDISIKFIHSGPIARFTSILLLCYLLPLPAMKGKLKFIKISFSPERKFTSWEFFTIKNISHRKKKQNLNFPSSSFVRSPFVFTSALKRDLLCSRVARGHDFMCWKHRNGAEWKQLVIWYLIWRNF